MRLDAAVVERAVSAFEARRRAAAEALGEAATAGGLANALRCIRTCASLGLDRLATAAATKLHVRSRAAQADVAAALQRFLAAVFETATSVRQHLQSDDERWSNTDARLSEELKSGRFGLTHDTGAHLATSCPPCGVAGCGGGGANGVDALLRAARKCGRLGMLEVAHGALEAAQVATRFRHLRLGWSSRTVTTVALGYFGDVARAENERPSCGSPQRVCETDSVVDLFSSLANVHSSWLVPAAVSCPQPARSGPGRRPRIVLSSTLPTPVAAETQKPNLIEDIDAAGAAPRMQTNDAGVWALMLAHGCLPGVTNTLSCSTARARF